MPAADLLAAAAQPPTEPGLCDNPVVSKLPICLVEDAVSNAAEGVAAGIIGELAQAFVTAVAEILGAVLEFLAGPVRPDLQAQSYGAQFGQMVTASATFAVLLFLLGLCRAMLRRSPRELGRVVGYTVGAFAVSGVALWAVQAFVALTDAATAQVADGIPGDMAETFAGLTKPLTPLATGNAGQALLAVLLGFAVALGALAVYLELFVRNVMIHVVAYFVPLMLVGAIYGPTRGWARRGIEFLGVLVLSKFVLYATIALGWSSVAAFDDERLSTRWASVLTGIVLLGVAAFLPWLLFKMLPFMEAQVAAGFTRHQARAAVTAPATAATSSLRTVESNLRRAASVAAAVGSGGAAAGLARAAAITGGVAGGDGVRALPAVRGGGGAGRGGGIRALPSTASHAPQPAVRPEPQVRPPAAAQENQGSQR